MTSISELLISNIDSIAANYAVNIAEPTHALVNVRERLIGAGGTIHPFTQGTDLEGKTLIAVDGGRVTQKLAGGDLIVVGATVGEGYSSKQLFDAEEDFPSEAYSAIIPHTSQNQGVEAGIMAALELRLFEKTKANVKIIDGAYLGNVSQVLFTLISNDVRSSDLILSLNNFDEDGYLRKAIRTILHPTHASKKDHVAVVKSDSSFYYSKEILGEGSELSSQISDRILASRILESGEFLEPRPLNSNGALITSLERLLRTDYTAESVNPSLLKEIIEGKNKNDGVLGYLRRLDNEATEEAPLYATYFKPSAWSDYAPAVNIQFVHFNDYGGTAKDRAEELIQLIDQDILQDGILEPWSQYSADRRAKDVSLGATIIKNYLIDHAESEHEISGLLRNYRT
jgi:hypothetical protein